MKQTFILYASSDFGTIEKHILSSSFQELIDEAHMILARSVKFLKLNEPFTARIYSTADLTNRSKHIPILWECYFQHSINCGSLVRLSPDDVLPEEQALKTAEFVKDATK